MAGEAREKCGVSAVVLDGTSKLDAAELNYEILYALQHRGPESSGIATQTFDSGEIESHKGNGQVKSVYREEDITRLSGSVGIGQNRYSTDGGDQFIQPFVDRPLGMALGHNGNLPVYDKLDGFLTQHGINGSQTNDTMAMHLGLGQFMRTGHDLPSAVREAYPYFTGAFSCVAMHDNAVVAFRDAYGIRPLSIGLIEAEGYVVASETCGLDIVGADFVRDVAPGEMVVINEDGIASFQLAEGSSKLDIFEFVYFARPDSMLYGERVNEVRRRFGQELAVDHPPIADDTANIVVVPVPETSIPEAEGYGHALGLEVVHALTKNRYIGRTFLHQTNGARHEQLRRKHNIIPEAIAGKDVIYIDDSIVRLNTLPRLVKLARDAGAKTVTVLIGSPPVRFPDFYGIDTPEQKELAAANLNVEETRQRTGCDYLGYLSLDHMIRATRQPAESFNLSCFTGEYPISIGYHQSDIQTPRSMEYVE